MDVHVRTDSTTITQDDYVPHILHKDQQAGLDCSVVCTFRQAAYNYSLTLFSP